MRRTRTRRSSKTASRRAGPRKTAILIQTEEERPHTIFAWLRAQRSKLHFGKRHAGHGR